MLFSVSGVVMLQNGESKSVVQDFWASDIDDARSYFEMACKANNAEMYQIHHVEPDTEAKLWHKYQVKEFNGAEYGIVRDDYKPSKGITEIMLVADNYTDYSLALFDCYALINGLMEEPMPLTEQYVISSK